MSKSHLLLNANILGLGTSVLCVVEYIENKHAPNDVFFIAEYDEIEDTLQYDFSLFENLNQQKFISETPFNKLLEIQSWMEKINYGGNKTQNAEICGYEISQHFKKKYDKEIDSLTDVDIPELKAFIKDCFYKDYLQELHYRALPKNPWSEALLESLLDERNKILKDEK